MTNTNNPTSEEELKNRLFEKCEHDIEERYGEWCDGQYECLCSDEFEPYYVPRDINAEELLTLIHQYGNTRERQGELYQLKMLQHWQNLHGKLIEPEDLQHSIKSLERLPEQPLARGTLDRLSKLQEKQDEQIHSII